MKTKKRGMKIGILTAGGDCPGLNAAIRGVGKTAILKYGMQVLGISSGFQGLLEMHYHELTENNLSGILTLGGTILGTSREKPFRSEDGIESAKPDKIIKNYRTLGLDGLVCIGGNGTLKTASLLAHEGLNIIGIPKTIDNDVWGTDVTFGFDSAVNIITDALDRLHTTANSHKRIMVVEVMGHSAGWLALYSGLSGGGDVILLPEIKFDINIVCEYLLRRSRLGKPYSIVIAAEGINIDKKKKKKISAGHYIAKKITKITGLETRETILGYLQRGGTPSPSDRILATRFGACAVELMAGEMFGQMTALKDNLVVPVPLADIAGKTRRVSPEDQLIKDARLLDTCFGDGKTGIQ